MSTKILPEFFGFGDTAFLQLRVTVLNQYTDEEGVEVLVTEELGEIRSDDDTLVVAFHDYTEE